MKICRFCGGKTENSTKCCTNCGSLQFLHICPNCSNEFDGSFCPTCGTRFDAPSCVCPNCNIKFYSKSCPNCGYSKENRNTPRFNLGTRRITGDASPIVVVALIISVIGISTCIIPFPIISLVIALRERKNENNSARTIQMANATMWVSIIGIVMTGLFFAVYLFAAVLSQVK